MALPREFERLIAKARPVEREYARKGVDELVALGIASGAELVAQLPRLQGEALQTAIWWLRLFGRRLAVPPAIALLAHPDSAARSYAALVLGKLGGGRAIRALAEALSGYPDPETREQCAYGLAFSFDERAYEPLLAAYQDPAQPPAVRAQAAEGFANLLGYSDRRRRRFRVAAAALIQGLRDPAPEVRFWSAFALGQMRGPAAVPELERLSATDEAMVTGWWTVNLEASDALRCIRTGTHPDRDFRKRDLRGCDFRRADLHDADFTGADLRGADLREANLMWAQLEAANLEGALLRGAECSTHTRWPDGFDPVASGARLVE